MPWLKPQALTLQNKKDDASLLRSVARRFMGFCQTYQHHFIAKGMNSTGHARHYLAGLLGTQRRKNIETIHNDTPDNDYQGMEQFIGTSP